MLARDCKINNVLKIISQTINLRVCFSPGNFMWIA